MKPTRIACLAGDGIGPELMGIALPLLNDVCNKRGHPFEAPQGAIGWAAYDAHGDTMPKVIWELCDSSDAILFGAVGLPARDHELAEDLRPERHALLPLRAKYGLGCNIRPVTLHPALVGISPLEKLLRESGLNMTFFRELIGGDYFGKRRVDPNGQWAEDVCRYDAAQIASIATAAFEYAQRNGQRVTSIDKANVLGATGWFWRKIVQEVHDRLFPDVSLKHMYVDAFNAAMIKNPGSFQVVLCSNAHGDILSDGAAVIAGSLGLLPSASINRTTGYALYEPGAGSAPDIAGQGIANPIGMILSVAMLFHYTFGDYEAALAIEQAVHNTLAAGFRTRDLICDNVIPPTITVCGTNEMYVEIRKRINLESAVAV